LLMGFTDRIYFCGLDSLYLKRTFVLMYKKQFIITLYQVVCF
jgi:hypothetical protein